jgi:hypothetical protein
MTACLTLRRTAAGPMRNYQEFDELGPCPGYLVLPSRPETNGDRIYH